MNNKRLLFLVGGVTFFVIIVLVWYFFYAKPATAPSLSETNNPLSGRILPTRFQFLTWGQDEMGTSTTSVTDPLQAPLVQVWNKPATGQTFITQEVLKEVLATTTQGTSTIEIKRTIRATSTVLIFVDKITGYIYGYPLEIGVPFQISNTIIPGVHDAYFFEGGRRVIIRYIDQERNVVTALVATVPDVKPDDVALPLINTSYLSSLVTSVAVNGRKDRASYVVNTNNGSSIYTISSSGTVLIDSSPFKEWVLSYGGESLFVTSKPSAYVLGVTARIPSFNLQTSERTGLMTNPNSGGELLNSMWASNGLTTFITKDGNDVVLPIKTLASKCTWGLQDFLVCAVPSTLPKAKEGLPDDWFQGRVSFNDNLYIVDKNTGESFPYYIFNNEEGVYDITNISLLSTNDVLSFIRKQDATLWMVNTNRIVPE